VPQGRVRFLHVPLYQRACKPKCFAGREVTICLRAKEHRPSRAKMHGDRGLGSERCIQALVAIDHGKEFSHHSDRCSSFDRTPGRDLAGKSDRIRCVVVFLAHSRATRKGTVRAPTLLVELTVLEGSCKVKKIIVTYFLALWVIGMPWEASILLVVIFTVGASAVFGASSLLR
jgi:hypothetical protein